VKTYSSIRTWSDVPDRAPALIPETSVLDFKAEATSSPEERAKDVAAFANALGGVILIGVAEKSDSFERKLLSLSDARRVAREYEDTVRDLLAPRPTIDAVVVECPNRPGFALVAVNCDPFPGQVVGARASEPNAWRFPVRTASRHSAYLDPEKAMIHSDPRARKSAILLSSISAPERKNIYVQIVEHWVVSDHPPEHVRLNGELCSVQPEANTAEFCAVLSDHSERFPFAVPLEDVVSVWKAPFGWLVRIAGVIKADTNNEGRRILTYLSSLDSTRDFQL
jgi:hypothetical protein